MKKLLFLSLILILASSAFAYDPNYCSEQLGGLSDSGDIRVSKVCVNSQEVRLSFKDYSKCDGPFTYGGDKCIKKLGKKHDQVLEIDRIDEIKQNGKDVSKYHLVNVKTGKKSTAILSQTRMDDCLADNFKSEIIGKDMTAYYLCHSEK